MRLAESTTALMIEAPSQARFYRSQESFPTVHLKCYGKNQLIGCGRQTGTEAGRCGTDKSLVILQGDLE
jgi:hypothetical protein